jgi:hypothetical protein
MPMEVLIVASRGKVYMKSAGANIVDRLAESLA